MGRISRVKKEDGAFINVRLFVPGANNRRRKTQEGKGTGKKHWHTLEGGGRGKEGRSYYTYWVHIHIWHHPTLGLCAGRPFLGSDYVKGIGK
jgi:hypothetical protein